MYISEWKTPLQRHQDCLKAIYECKTAEDFDAIPSWIDQYNLPEKNRKTMADVIINQRRLLKADPSSRADEIAEEYNEVDAESFSKQDIDQSWIKIEISGWTDTNVSVDPLDAIPEQKEPEIEIWIGVGIIDDTPKAKRTRKTKEEGVQSVNNSMSITLKRRINLPVAGVEYSNNEFGCEVTASTKEEAQSLLEELMTEFMADSGLVRKSTMNEMIAIEKNKSQPTQTKEVIKEVEKVVYKRSPEDDLELRRYARVQLFMQALAKDATILPAMQRVKAEFEKTNPKF